MEFKNEDLEEVAVKLFLEIDNKKYEFFRRDFLEDGTPKEWDDLEKWEKSFWLEMATITLNAFHIND